MSKPYEHAVLSVKKWGGKTEDYMPIHDFMDSSKAHVADMRHRALLHSSFGCYLAEQVFGTNIWISKTRKQVSVRDIAEQHIIQDLGFIPSVQQYLDHMELAEWMGGKKKKSFTIVLKGPEESKDMWGEQSTHWLDLGKGKGVNKPSKRYTQPEKLTPETLQLLKNAAANGATLDGKYHK